MIYSCTTAAGGGVRQTEGDTVRNVAISIVLFLLSVFAASCSMPVQEGGDSVDSVFEEIVAIERSALDSWVTGDPQGYLDILAPEVTYFDPNQEKRTDGLDAMIALLGPIKDVKLPFTDPRYEMIAPKIQHHGDVALLTFNLVNYGKLADQPETVLARWNSTQVYRRIDAEWKIIHSHWSYIKPELRQARP
jgi:ketosteroid isomerase-like protein